MSYFWLSFVDNNKPEGECFLGVSIVKGEDLEDVIRKTHSLNINPGGEIMSCEIPSDYKYLDKCELLENKLLGLKELAQHFDDLVQV